MFKGSENYSFEMDESCTCQVYQSCTLYISFPLASMHNFPSMQIFCTAAAAASSERRLARLSQEHVPWHGKWIIAPEQGTKQCNFVYGRFENFFFWGGEIKSEESAEHRRLCWNQRIPCFCSSAQQQQVCSPSNHGSPLTSQASAWRRPRVRRPSVSLCKYHHPSDEN